MDRIVCVCVFLCDEIHTMAMARNNRHQANANNSVFTDTETRGRSLARTAKMKKK